MKKRKTPLEMPDRALIEQELRRERHGKKFGMAVRSTVYTLITVAAVAVLVATLWLPVLQIYGNSMTPTLENGDIIVSLKEGSFAPGDMVALYYNNKILVKLVIALEGQRVDIKDDGTVYVDEELLHEPYLTEKAFGECDIELPFQVPEGRLFVMGDHRSISIDSRSTTVGCVGEEQIVGRMAFRLWPLDRFGGLTK